MVVRQLLLVTVLILKVDSNIQNPIGRLATQLLGAILFCFPFDGEPHEAFSSLAHYNYH